MAERTVRFPTSELVPSVAPGNPPASAGIGGYSFHELDLYNGARRLGAIIRASVERGTTMAVTIDPVMTTRVPVLLSIWSARVAEARWMTIVVRAADATRAIKLATAAAREYKEPDEDLTVTVELLDPRGPEGVVLVDAN